MAFEPVAKTPLPAPPKPEYGCIHCGPTFWERFLDPVHGAYYAGLCRIDALGRTCEGRCSQYQPRWWAAILEPEVEY